MTLGWQEQRIESEQLPLDGSAGLGPALSFRLGSWGLGLLHQLVEFQSVIDEHGGHYTVVDAHALGHRCHVCGRNGLLRPIGIDDVRSVRTPPLL